MQKCLELACKGIGNVSPNPMVGCVIVYNNKIIGQGYHKQYGFAHAEVNAINNVQDKRISRKVIDQENIISRFKGFISSSLNDEIIEITMQIRKITKLSIFWNGVGNLDGN